MKPSDLATPEPADDFESEDEFEAALAQAPEKPVDEVDPFDPENLRVDQSQIDLGVGKPIYTTLAVRKPKKTEWFQVNPSDKYKIRIAFFEDEASGEIYALTPGVREQLKLHDYRTATLHLCVNRQGVPFLWPIKKSGVDGKANRWFDSANEAASIAQKGWIRMSADSDSYVVYPAITEFAPPSWPEKNMKELLKLAFRERMIQDMEHPLIRQLRGLA